MSMEDSPLEQEIREFVREYSERGNSHIKSPRIAKALDVPVQQVTPIVGDMVRDGTLEVWSDNSNATVYRIQL